MRHWIICGMLLLWCGVVHAAEKTSHDKPKGLPNIGLTCHLNSMLQILAPTQLIKNIKQIPGNNKCWKAGLNHQDPILLIRNFFKAYDRAVDVVSRYLLQNLAEALIKINVLAQTCIMQDAATDLLKLFEAFDASFKNKFICNQSLVTTNAVYSFELVHTNDNEPTVMVRASRYMLVTHSENVLESLAMTFEAQNLGELGVRREFIWTLPDLLFIDVALKYGTPQQDLKKCIFPLELSLAGYLHTSSQESRENATYDLKSIALFRPGQGAHYVAAFGKYDSGWWFCNDTFVEKIDLKDMQDFGKQGVLKKFVPKIFVYERKTNKGSAALLHQDVTTALVDLHAHLALF